MRDLEIDLSKCVRFGLVERKIFCVEVRNRTKSNVRISMHN